jgi:hypothetical protein
MPFVNSAARPRTRLRLEAQLLASRCGAGRRIVEREVAAQRVHRGERTAEREPAHDATGAADLVAREHLAAAVGARRLGGDRGAAVERERGVEPDDVARRQRILVARDRRAHAHARLGRDVAAQAVHPERTTARFALVGDTDRNRIQVLVEARHGPAEQQPAGERLERVVGEARLGCDAEDDGGLVAIAHQHLDTLAAKRAVGMRQRVRTRDAEAGQLVDDLVLVAFRCKGVESAGVRFERHDAAVQPARERADEAIGREGRLVVAVERVRAIAFELQVQAARGLRLELMDRRVADEVVALVGPDVAEQPAVLVTLRVERERHPHAVAHHAVREQRRARAAFGAAVVVAHE